MNVNMFSLRIIRKDDELMRHFFFSIFFGAIFNQSTINESLTSTI